MKKAMIAGLISLWIVGCASSTVAVQVVDFDSSIQAYNANRDISYLKSANTYAVTDKQKALLEKKLVEHMGVDKVFDVEITNSMGDLKSGHYTGLMSSAKGATKDVHISIRITPKANLPFELKYNSYKIWFALKETKEFDATSDFSKPVIKTLSDLIYTQTFTLSPSNNWNYETSTNNNVVIYAKSVGFLNDGAKSKLIKLTYSSVMRSYPDNAIVYDAQTGTQWQNFYPMQNDNNIKKIKITPYYNTIRVNPYDSEDEAKDYCKNLDLDGKGWELPSLNHLKALSQNKALLAQMKGVDLWYSSRNDRWGHAVRLSDSAIKDLDGNEIVGIRCIKSRKFDPSTGLEWTNKLKENGYAREAKEYCEKLGSGWRLPTPSEQSSVIKNNSIVFTENADRNDYFWTSEFDPNLRTPSIPATIVQPNGEITTQSEASSFMSMPFRCVRRK